MGSGRSRRRPLRDARGSLLNATQQALGLSYANSARVDHQQEDVIDLDMARRSPPSLTPDLDLGDRRNAAQRSLGGVLSMILVPFIMVLAPFDILRVNLNRVPLRIRLWGDAIGFGDAVVIGIAFAALVFFAQWIGWDWGTSPS